MRRRKFLQSWLNIMETRPSLILMSAIGCSSFAWGEKALKIRDSAGDRQISKIISESRDQSKHYLMLQFETLLKLPALLHQWYSLPSLKVFVERCVTGDRPPQFERASEAKENPTCCFAAGRA
jgi:hypothetical protein